MDTDLQINIYKVPLSPQSHRVSHLVSPQIMLYFLALCCFKYPNLADL